MGINALCLTLYNLGMCLGVVNNNIWSKSRVIMRSTVCFYIEKLVKTYSYHHLEIVNRN